MRQSPKCRLWYRISGTALAAAVCAGLLLCLGGCRPHEPEQAAVAPRDANLLLITLDTTRADHLSCYAEVAGADSGPTSAGLKSGATSNATSSAGLKAGATSSGKNYARTPHLDALAARGVLFLHATAQVPLTLPSHACIMTGAYPPVHGLRDMGGFVLDTSHPTIASLSQAAGFQTAAFVGSRAVAHRFGLAHGFDTYEDRKSVV